MFRLQVAVKRAEEEVAKLQQMAGKAVEDAELRAAERYADEMASIRREAASQLAEAGQRAEALAKQLQESKVPLVLACHTFWHN